MPTPPPDPWLGKKIREYEILELLGSGGMGAVYKARHVYLDEERALKVIHSEVATAGGFIDRFIREARILSKLRSPHLVELYEFGTLDAQTFFMVMEFLRGESVLARLRKVDRFPVLRAINIAREAALGLEAAHLKGIVHRDISPDNLLLVRNDRGDETTKVIDFGIAKPLAESVQSVTATNVFIGNNCPCTMPVDMAAEVVKCDSPACQYSGGNYSWFFPLNCPCYPPLGLDSAVTCNTGAGRQCVYPDYPFRSYPLNCPCTPMEFALGCSPAPTCTYPPRVINGQPASLFCRPTNCPCRPPSNADQDCGMSFFC